MELHLVEIKKKDNCNIIIGQSHFIKSVEDIHEIIVSIAPSSEFGIAFCEASGKSLIRFSGTNNDMISCAVDNANKIACGHSFFIALQNIYPIQILNALKLIPEICTIYCATANQVKVVVAQDNDQRAIIGIMDGNKPKGIESNEDKKERFDLLRNIGYKVKL